MKMEKVSDLTHQIGGVPDQLGFGEEDGDFAQFALALQIAAAPQHAVDFQLHPDDYPPLQKFLCRKQMNNINRRRSLFRLNVTAPAPTSITRQSTTSNYNTMQIGLNWEQPTMQPGQVDEISPELNQQLDGAGLRNANKSFLTRQLIYWISGNLLSGKSASINHCVE